MAWVFMLVHTWTVPEEVQSSLSAGTMDRIHEAKTMALRKWSEEKSWQKDMREMLGVGQSSSDDE